MRKIVAVGAEVLSNPRLYLEYWAQTYNYQIKANAFSTLYLDHREDVGAFLKAHPSFKFKSLTRLDLEAALEEFLNELPNIRRKELAKALVCTKEDLTLITAWVKAVTGSDNADDVHIMAHWLWLVKRNALDLPVVYHIMPIVTSPKQGGGKSTAIHALIKPVQDLTLELKVPQVVDERSFTMFTNYLVGFFDEMAGAEKVEISDFKRVVTSSTLTYRPMRTNAQISIKNRCSSIGASNSVLYEIVKDTTGLRRFFPLNALDLLDHAAINAIDYIALWRGIDEQRSRGYFELVKDTVAKKQDELAMKDEVQLFLEEHGVMPTSLETKTVNGKHLYNEYIIHTKNSGIKFPVSAQTFYKKLRTLGLQATRKADDRKVLTWYFAVSPEAVLDNEKRLHAI